MVDPDPGGLTLYLDKANKDVSSSQGRVGSQTIGPLIDIEAIDNVGTSGGYANIKPVKDGALTRLTLTPQDGDLFGDFSFRRQLLASAGGEVKVTVQDNQGGAAQVFTFTILGSNADFGRIGIVQVPDSAQTISGSRSRAPSKT
jgi:hypothetical protein